MNPRPRLRIHQGKRDKIPDLSGSAIDIEHWYSSHGALEAMQIELIGPIAQLPSSANEKRIFTRISKKTGKVARFIASSPGQQHKLAGFQSLFLEYYMSRGTDHRPSFGSENVHLLLLLAERSNRHDSHNFIKSACDWIASVGIVDNDHQIEAMCLKKSEHPKIRNHYPSTTPLAISTNTTTIIIQRRKAVQTLITRTAGELLEIAHQRKTLIG
jgi:hypothetical protein